MSAITLVVVTRFDMETTIKNVFELDGGSGAGVRSHQPAFWRTDHFHCSCICVQPCVQTPPNLRRCRVAAIAPICLAALPDARDIITAHSQPPARSCTCTNVCVTYAPGAFAALDIFGARAPRGKGERCTARERGAECAAFRNRLMFAVRAVLHHVCVCVCKRKASGRAAIVPYTMQ